MPPRRPRRSKTAISKTTSRARPRRSGRSRSTQRRSSSSRAVTIRNRSTPTPRSPRSGPFGGLIASGWHTASSRHAVAGARTTLPRGAALASPGIDELRWMKPVRPGDPLRVRATVLEAQPLAIEARPRDRAHADRGGQSARRGRDAHDRDEHVPLPEREDRLTRNESTTAQQDEHRAAAAGVRRRLAVGEHLVPVRQPRRTLPLSTGSRFGDVSPLPWITRTQR